MADSFTIDTSPAPTPDLTTFGCASSRTHGSHHHTAPTVPTDTAGYQQPTGTRGRG